MSSKYLSLKMQTGECIWTIIDLDKLANRLTSTFASGVGICKWSFKNIVQRCCCDRGKKMM